MTTFTNDLQRYQDSRRMPNWKPKRSATQHKPGQTQEDKIKDEVVKRCLAFIELEIQVQQWVDKVRTNHPNMSDEDATALEETLARNSKDEEKHDKALRHLADYYGGAHKSSPADELVSDWQSTDVSPIVAAYALECGVFFTILPLLMNCGDVYAATIAGWINDDERVHVETNLRIMKQLGLKLNQHVLGLVYNTVNFIYAPYGQDRATKEATRSVQRVISGRDKQMLRESLPSTINFFEQHNKQSIVY